MPIVEKEISWSENRYWTISPVRFQPIRKADVPISPIIPRYFYFDILTPIRENVRNNDKKGQARLFFLKKKSLHPYLLPKKSTDPPFWDL